LRFLKKNLHLKTFYTEKMIKTGLIILSILFIILVLLQQKNSSLGSMMGQDAGDEMVQTRRGAEKIMHQLTIVIAILLMSGGFYLMIQN